MKIGLVVNDFATEAVDYTTTHLALAGTNRGHEMWYINVSDFGVAADDAIYARARRIPTAKHRSVSVYLEQLTAPSVICERINLADLDVLMLRNDPSEDVIKRPWARLAAINFSRLAMKQKPLVVNDPERLLLAVNKLYLQYFPREIRPITLVTRDKQDILEFAKAQGGTVVLKPLYGSGGRNVFLFRPEDAPNANQIMDSVSRDGYIIAQEYLPRAVDGDTRLFLLNGEPLVVEGKYAAVHRIRKGADMRSNMTAGASAGPANITEAMLKIVDALKPKLVEDGMYFVGLDIVGSKVMEINVFSPGGLNSAEIFEEQPFSSHIIQDLEEKVRLAAASDYQLDNRTLACRKV